MPRFVDPVGQVVDTVEAGLEDLVDEMMVAYAAALPAYASAPPALLADVRAGAVASVSVGLAQLRGEAGPEGMRAALADVGRRRAQQGIPLPDVLLAYQVGARVFWNRLVAVAPPAADDRVAVLTAGTRVMLAVLEHAVTAVSTGYQEAAVGLLADEEHDLQAVVEALATTWPVDQATTERAARRDIHLGGLRWCVVVEPGALEIGSLVRAVRQWLPGGAAGRVEGNVMAFVSARPEPRWPASDAGAPGGVGWASVGEDGPPGAARRARAASRVASHLGHGPVRYDDVVPLAAVLDGPPSDRAAFIAARLGPVLRAAGGDELVRSLAAFYRNGQSLAPAARELFVHRHTLEYRLARVHELIGADPREPLTRMLLELAIALRDESGEGESQAALP